MPNENRKMKMDSNEDEFELPNHVGMAQHWLNRIPFENICILYSKNVNACSFKDLKYSIERLKTELSKIVQ